MKRKYYIWFVILIALLVGVSYFDINFSRSYHHRLSKTTDLKDENISGIYLGDRIDDEKVESQYGKITEFSHDNVMYDYYFLSENIEVATEKNGKKIIRFVVNDKNIESYKGVKIGDSKERVVDLYGDNYYERLEQGTNIIGYVDKNKKTSIEFWLGINDEVVFYRLDYNFLE